MQEPTYMHPLWLSRCFKISMRSYISQFLSKDNLTCGVDVCKFIHTSFVLHMDVVYIYSHAQENTSICPIINLIYILEKDYNKQNLEKVI